VLMLTVHCAQLLSYGWADYIERVDGIVRIVISAKDMLRSPAYAGDAKQAELHAANLAKRDALE
jgi:hypothetical protein